MPFTGAMNVEASGSGGCCFDDWMYLQDGSHLFKTER